MDIDRLRALAGQQAAPVTEEGTNTAQAILDVIAKLDAMIEEAAPELDHMDQQDFVEIHYKLRGIGDTIKNDDWEW